MGGYKSRQNVAGKSPKRLLECVSKDFHLNEIRRLMRNSKSDVIVGMMLGRGYVVRAARKNNWRQKTSTTHLAVGKTNVGWIIDLGPCPQKRCVSKWRAPTTFRRLSCEVSETAIVWQLSDDSPATFRRRAGDMFATFLVLSGGVPATDVLPDGGGILPREGSFVYLWCW